jgi:pimeloyl-ACP methyl ester carboxylesterase
LSTLPDGEPVCFQGDGLKLAGLAFGDAAAPPILFFHGHGQSKKLWSQAAQLVTQRGFRGISIDLRGHGDSGWADDGDYSMEGYARDVVNVIDALDGPVTLAGASRGGYVALLAATWRPDRIRLLMMCDVVPTAKIEGRNWVAEFFDLSVRGFASIEDVAEALTKYLQFPVPHPERLRSTLRERDGRFYFRWDPQTSAPQYFEVDVSELIAGLGSFKVPTVVLRGQRESLISIEALREFKALVPHAVIEAVQGMRHIFTTADNPLAAARLLYHLEQGAGAPAKRALQ